MSVTAARGPVAALVERVRRGDRGALARAISAIENETPEADDLVAALSGSGEPGASEPGAHRLAVTGPPGAGKSTLVGQLISTFLDTGRRVGVLLVDPSSPVTGGALLADRIRLQRRGGAELFVRSVASRGHAGGITAATPTLVRLLEAWGADIVVIETVGAGQGDVEACRVADHTIVLCPPGLGDDLQAMKAGLMELADVFVVNKADRPGADQTAASLGRSGRGGRGAHASRPIVRTVATTGDGVGELVDTLDNLLAEQGRRAGSTPPTGAHTVVAPRPATLPSVFDLTGRTAIVTGATAGLGRRFAEVLHAAGANVVLAGRRADRLEDLHRTLSRSVAVPCDITGSEDRARLVVTAIREFGALDVLVNNAGVSGSAVPSAEHPWDRWQQTFDVNISGLFGLIQLAVPHMLERGRGSIVNIASVFGLVANAPVHDAAYAATKGAVVNLTRALGVEWATRGVRVNAIAPGWFPSEMTADMVDDEASQRYVRRYCPMERMGRENELDGAILFLASDASSYCTGQTISVDGGWTAR